MPENISNTPCKKMDISLFDAPVSKWNDNREERNALVAEAVARENDPRVRDAFGWTPLLKSAMNAHLFGLEPFALLIPLHDEKELLSSIPAFSLETFRSTAALLLLASGKILSKEASDVCEQIWSGNKSAGFSNALKVAQTVESLDPRSLFEASLRGKKGYFSSKNMNLKTFLDTAAEIISETPEYAPLVAAVLSKRVGKAFEDKYLGNNTMESGERLKEIIAGAMAAQAENEEPETGPAI